MSNENNYQYLLDRHEVAGSIPAHPTSFKSSVMLGVCSYIRFFLE